MLLFMLLLLMLLFNKNIPNLFYAQFILLYSKCMPLEIIYILQKNNSVNIQ